MSNTRYARVTKGWATKSTAAYLPGNYHVIHEDEECIYLAGEDNAGWTLDDYVIPRLASGCIYATEIEEGQVPHGALD